MTSLGYRLVAASIAGVLLLLPAGCGHPVQRQLQGRWFGHSVENVDTAELAQVTRWARGTSFEFSGARVTITVPEQAPQTAPFKVVATSATEATLVLQRPDGTLDEARFSLDEEDVVRWHVNDRQAMLLRRER